MPTANQIRQACKLLGWSRLDLQCTTALPFDVVDRVLTANYGGEITIDQEVIVGNALHRAGVIFIETNGDEPSVKMRKVEG